MSIDRKSLLSRRSQARAALSDPNLPDQIKAKFKKAMDHADVALGLDQAIKHKQTRTPGSQTQNPR